jgi:Xaa-Pro aminopeptidase
MQHSRLGRLRDALRREGIDGFLVSSLPAIRYFTGFSGSHALLVVTSRRALFLTDTRYAEQSRMEVRGVGRRITRENFPEAVLRSGALKGCRTLGFQADDLTVAELGRFKKRFAGFRFRPEPALLESLMLVKEGEEIALLEQAAEISDSVFLQVLKLIRPGMRESEIAAQISFLQRRSGGEGDAFEVIVAGGPRGALPHARASERPIRRGELVILDFGCVVGGYHSDLTRTVAVGRASARAREVHSTVLRAQQQALAVARAGLRANELDSVSRSVIREAGYGRRFVHSLGHGLGLHIHERPRISPSSKEVLQAGSVITIEPGIYLPGWGGVRIEDDCVLLEGGCRMLSKSPKDLVIL